MKKPNLLMLVKQGQPSHLIDLLRSDSGPFPFEDDGLKADIDRSASIATTQPKIVVTPKNSRPQVIPPAQRMMRFLTLMNAR